MIRPALVLSAFSLLLAASQARAQSFPVRLDDTKYRSLSRADCTLEPQETTNFAFSWTRNIAVAGEQETVYVSRTSSCSDDTTGTTPNALLLRSEAARTQATGRFPAAGTTEVLTTRKLFDFVSTDCGETTGIETTVYLCVKIEIPSNGVTIAASQVGSVAVKLDSLGPAQPTQVVADPRDGGLSISWEMPTDLLGATRYVVHVRDAAGNDFGSGVAGSASRSATIDGLTNDLPYQVSVSSFDDSGTKADRNNESAASETVAGTPRTAQGFFDRYRALGGGETGSCNATGGSLLALVGLLAGRRRRRRASTSAVITAVAIVTTVAISLPVQAVELAAPVEPLHSPRHFALSLKLGNYTPAVDLEPGLVAAKATPYADMFGTGGALMWRAQLEYDLLDTFGRLSLGLSAGTWRVKGAGRSAANPTVVTDDDTELVVNPLTPVLTYRADMLWTRNRIPLVPYGTLGYGFANWSATKNGTVTTLPGAEGTGWARGLEWALGLQFVLDAVEPDKAASLDTDYGINSTSLFVEYAGMYWEGAHGLRLHGDSWSGGVLVAF